MIITPGVYTDEIVNVDSTAQIEAWANGLPYTAAQALAIGSGPIAYHSNGVPFNVEGRVVASDGPAVVFQGSFSYDANGAWAQPSLRTEGLSGDVDAGPNTVYENAVTGTEVGIEYNYPSYFPVVYSITTQSTSGAFQIDATTGIVTVATSGLLAFETRPTETVTVRATDTVTEEYVEVEFTITVTEFSQVSFTSGFSIGFR